MDGETADLFAFMDSTILELQMEMEMLDNKEYESDNISQVPVKDDSVEIEEPPDLHRVETPEDDIEQEFTALTEETRPSEKLETPTIVKSKSLDWEAMEPAKLGDQDYVPVSDYSPKRKKVVADVREQRDDDLEEHMEECMEDSSSFVSLEPAKVGDDDYVPVSDYSNVDSTAKQVTPEKGDNESAVDHKNTLAGVNNSNDTRTDVSVSSKAEAVLPTTATQTILKPHRRTTSTKKLAKKNRKLDKSARRQLEAETIANAATKTVNEADTPETNIMGLIRNPFSYWQSN